MKTLTVVSALAIGLAVNGFAAQFKGFVEDTKCSTMAAMKDDADCAKKCIKGGSPAVLVTDDGKVFKIDDQAKVTPMAGKQVTIMGTMAGDTIKVASVK